MEMKDKLNKVGRKTSQIFNRKNILIAFVSLVVFASVAIPAYFSVAATGASAKADAHVISEPIFGENTILEVSHTLTYTQQ